MTNGMSSVFQENENIICAAGLSFQICKNTRLENKVLLAHILKKIWVRINVLRHSAS